MRGNISTERSLLKERGAFYTPPAMAAFLASWAIRDAGSTVLDPSSGDGEFLLASISRLRTLGAEPSKAAEQVFGVEQNPSAREAAVTRLASTGMGEPKIALADFFSTRPESRGFDRRLDALTLKEVDAVVGNPPYIRYHDFGGEARASAASAVARFGIRLTDLTSSWAPFLVHSTTFLKADGRLAYVLPGELMTVDYARPIREFLLSQFEAVTIIAFEKRVFPGVLADTIFLLADRKSRAKGLSLVRLPDLSSLGPSTFVPSGDTPRVQAPDGARKWTFYLLPPQSRVTYRLCESNPAVAKLGSLATVDIGIVSGGNGFFLLTEEVRREWKIPPREVIPIISGSAQLRALRFGAKEFERLKDSGSKCWLLRLSSERRVSPESLRYLDSKFGREVRSGYKARARRLWYEVPSVYSPDAFMSYFISDAPRFAVNGCGATSTNTIHRIRLGQDSTAPILPIVLACHSSLTQLSAEVEGRSYGGGVAKLETKEAERLLIPLPAEDQVKELRLAEPGIRRALVIGKLAEGTSKVDEILLEGRLRLNSKQRAELVDGLNSLRSRRQARMKRGSGGILNLGSPSPPRASAEN